MIKVRTPNQKILRKHDSSTHMLNKKQKPKKPEINNEDIIDNIILQ